MENVHDGEMVWHNDGHHISLQLNRAETVITRTFCPSGASGNCRHERVGCIVDYFIDRFGLDCNVGTCPMAEDIQICWSLVGDPHDIDSCQMWFVPNNDDVFRDWLTSKTQ